jgi:hypothetical protein
VRRVLRDADTSAELLRVRLADYVGARPVVETTPETLNRAFRGIASAIEIENCTAVAEETRLACLRQQLIVEHQRLAGAAAPSLSESVREAGTTAESANKIITLGTTVAVAVGKALGIST